VYEFVIGLAAVIQAVCFLLKKIEQDGHVFMVCTQFSEHFSDVITHIANLQRSVWSWMSGPWKIRDNTYQRGLFGLGKGRQGVIIEARPCP
jgi:hypothetical protein